MNKYYHVTPIENLLSIFQNGLVPCIGERSSLIDEELNKVYLFHSKEDVNNALMNWMGECFEEDCELVILELDIPNDFEIITEKDNNGDDFWESYAFQTIPSDFITKIFDEYDNELQKDSFLEKENEL